MQLHATIDAVVAPLRALVLRAVTLLDDFILVHPASVPVFVSASPYAGDPRRQHRCFARSRR